MLGAISALALAPALDAQVTHVIPNGTATAEGSGSSSYPWNRTRGEIRVMYVYDSTHFTDVGISYPILINGLKGRANGSLTATWTGGNYNGMTIDMGTAVYDWMVASVTFDANYGADRTQVFNGNATVKPSPIIGGAIPQPEFYAEAPFSTSFLYDPSSGNDLVVDFVIPTGSWVGGTSYSNDLCYGTAATPPAVGCRFWNLTASSPTAANASPQLHSSHVIELDYAPAKGLYPNFTADTTVGPEGMTVNFKDTSYSSDPGGIIAQSWTFGDGGTGAGPTPSHTYTCGVFDVSITVIDATASKSLTKTAFITAGQVSAAGSADATTGFAPLTVNFTNESVGTGATSKFLWEFGDGGTSSSENPMHVYAANGKYDVSLTVKSACDSDKVTYTGLIEVGVGKLETTFAGGNGLSAAGSGNLFDVNIKNPQGLRISSIDMSFWTAGVNDVEIWVTPGTYIGNDNLPAKWVQVSAGNATATAGGYGSRTHVDTDDFFLPPGKYGMYIISSAGVAYTNGNGTNQNYGNADLELSLGTGKGTKFAGSMFNPRVWNGAIFYNQDNSAAHGAIGWGCPGSSGTAPTLDLSAEPVLGTSTSIEIAGMTTTSGPGWLFIGMADPTGVDLTALGMTDCLLSANPIIITQGITNAGGSTSMPVPIPNVPSFAGVFIGLQAANVDAGANALGVAATAGLAVRMGN